MADSKVTTYAAAFLVVGILIGTAVGFALFHTDNAEKNETYWFYLDDGKVSDSKSGWYSAKSTDQCNALQKALTEKSVNWTFQMNDYGFSMDSIAGKLMEKIDGNWYWWSQYFWSGNEYVLSEVSFDKLEGKNIFLLIYGNGSEPIPDAAKTGGPFKP